MDTTKPVIYLVFTGHEFAEGFPVVHQALTRRGIKASFFFTGDFYRDPGFRDIINTLINEGHYLGAHSNKHLLYCSWDHRDSLLVTRKQFTDDLNKNYAEMKKFGIDRKDARFFMPPYEWYNKTISTWTHDLGLTLINFTPGTYSNQDWTYPELGKGYYSSDTLIHNILDYEKKYGMNGFILLTHMGTDPRRKDKLYYKLDSLLGILGEKGYKFARFEEKRENNAD